jgi:hypothetical protein
MLIGVLITFFNLLNRNDFNAILDIEQDTPVADPHPVSVFVACHGFQFRQTGQLRSVSTAS